VLIASLLYRRIFEHKILIFRVLLNQSLWFFHHIFYLRTPHYHKKFTWLSWTSLEFLGHTRFKRSISASIFRTKSRIANSLLVIWILTAGDIYSIQSTPLRYKTHSFFRCVFYYSFLEIPCVQTTLNFLSREIKIHFATQWTA